MADDKWWAGAAGVISRRLPDRVNEWIDNRILDRQAREEYARYEVRLKAGHYDEGRKPNDAQVQREQTRLGRLINRADDALVVVGAALTFSPSQVRAAIESNREYKHLSEQVAAVQSAEDRGIHNGWIPKGQPDFFDTSIQPLRAVAQSDMPTVSLKDNVEYQQRKVWDEKQQQRAQAWEAASPVANSARHESATSTMKLTP